MTITLSKNLTVSVLLLLHGNMVCAQEITINSQHGHGALTTISNFYSDIDMHVRLATKSNAKSCAEGRCTLNAAFDAQVQQLGERLAVTAYKTYPDLSESVDNFTFIVADKKEPCITSSGAGKIVIFRGIQNLELGEDAISFILAREMGHVIGHHHYRNTSTKLMFSVLASVLFPAVSLFSSTSNVAATATATLTSAASTTTSYLGSEVAISQVKPSQLIEADNIAINLLARQDWDRRSMESILELEDSVDTNDWLHDLYNTVHHLNELIITEDAIGPKTGTLSILKDDSISQQ